MPNGFSDSTIKNLAVGAQLWTNDFRANRNDKGVWTGSESFYCRSESLISLIPAIGTACTHPGFSTLGVFTVDIANYDGNIYQVTVNYKGREPTEFTFDDDPPEGEYSESLAIVTQEEPIESHYRFKRSDSGITAEERTILSNVKTKKFIPVSESQPYKFYEVNSNKEGILFELTSDRAKELADFYAKGIESYLQAYQVWRITFSNDTLPSANILNQVGFISTAKNAPAVGDGRDWLFVGCDISKQGDVYTINYEWRLSGPGGWEPKLYNKTQALA